MWEFSILVKVAISVIRKDRLTQYSNGNTQVCAKFPTDFRDDHNLFFTIRYMLENFKTSQNKILQHLTYDL